MAIGAVLATTIGRAVVVDPVQADSSVGAFEIDGNRPDDSGGSGDPVDWDSVTTGVPPVAVTSFIDEFGQGKEDGFGGNSKNLTPANWACADVATPDKDDIKTGAVGFRTWNGAQYVYFNFERVGNNGTADLDVELSGGSGTHPSPPCDGVLPPRIDGDLLVAFDQQGQTSTAADIHLYEWDGDASTGQLVEIATTNLFQGQLSADRTFAEGALNLSAALGRSIECGEFSTVYMKSRASDAINSDLKDRTETKPLDLGLCPTLSVTKTADAPSVSSGTAVGFTVTVTNGGPGTATAVTLEDPLPAGTGIAWSETPDNAQCSITGAPPAETLTCAFGDLAAGQSRTVHVGSSTGPATSGTLTNTATARASNSPDASATATTRVDRPGLSVVKTADEGTVDAGSPIGFTVTVANAGPGTATAVTLEDPLPSGTGLDWFESPDSPFCSVTGTPPDGTLVACSFGDLAPGQSRTVHVASSTTPATSGTFSNTAVVSATNQDPPVTSTTATVTVNQPSLVATKTADSPTATAGTPIGFSVAGHRGRRQRERPASRRIGHRLVGEPRQPAVPDHRHAAGRDADVRLRRPGRRPEQDRARGQPDDGRDVRGLRQHGHGHVGQRPAPDADRHHHGERAEPGHHQVGRRHVRQFGQPDRVHGLGDEQRPGHRPRRDAERPASLGHRPRLVGEPRRAAVLHRREPPRRVPHLQLGRPGG